MLQIKNISKQYKTGDLIQNALSDVTLNFRDNEFVSILGPSGSGKTTLLNIIGGLDRYDKGDLIINNVSTKRYKDRDWDSYRNHTVGFVFQSYNLIPHQTILANVELALTISGISKKERKRRAIEALEKVGLKQQIHKKPNQMSGGQMQRVAIARALVNNPDILLADEPTGALDTETSVQVMELLKQVANEKLVIMVTHNPELAEAYSTRIVNLKDGKILGDTDPFYPDVEKLEKPKHKNLGKSSMSILTAFSLSLKNLLTKKGRTLLTSFAGSIGIIGIALILSVSTGFQNYIDKIQEDTLTSYPLAINKETADASAMLLSMTGGNKDEEKEEGKVKESQIISDMFSKVGKNDTKAFKKYLSENEEKLNEMVSLVEYKYSVEPLIYTTTTENEIMKLNPSNLMASMGGGSSNMLMGSSMSVFNEMIDSKETLEGQYNVLAGRWNEKFDEVILILPDANSMSDLLAYSLGLRNPDELNEMIKNIMNDEKTQNNSEPLEFTYDELMNIPLKLVEASSTYKYNEKYEIYENMEEDKDFMQNVYNNSLDLKIVGIVTKKESVNSGALSTGIGYSKQLTEYVIKNATESEIVKKQQANEEINVFSNKRFDDKESKTGLDFQDMISIDKDALSKAFGTKINEKEIAKMTQGYMQEISKAMTTDTTQANVEVKNTLSTITKNMLNDYISKNGQNGIAPIKLGDVDKIVSEYLKTEECKKQLGKLEKNYGIPQDTFKTFYSNIIGGFLKGYISLGSNKNVNIDKNSANKNNQNTNNQANNSENKNNQEANNQENKENKNSQNVDDKDKNANNIVKVEKAENIASKNENKEASTVLVASTVDGLVKTFVEQEEVAKGIQTLAAGMTEANMQKTVLTKVGELTSELMKTMANAFKVDESKFASAFKFNLGEDEIKRLFETMSSKNTTQNANTNLITLGYQDMDDPTTIAFYFKDFESKEKFIDFIKDYNKKMEAEDEDKVIKYTDLTGILMSSVKVIVDSVSYVLIAFVSISLIVSSIMIGIITYISVLERTKEIGILRAIGASKRNISSIFNAETFIVGFFAGVLGIAITLLLLIPINKILSIVTGNIGIAAELPISGGIILVILSVILTLIGGLVPSKQAAKKDPVLALRSE